MSETPSNILFVTGGSGGIGKSTSARWVAHALRARTRRIILVDGNPGQQSQRAVLDIPDEYSLEAAHTRGLRHALVPPSQVDGGYALLAGPLDPSGPYVMDDYADAIRAAARMADWVVVDADRVDGRQWRDPKTFAGGIIRPMTQTGMARILYRVGVAGSQLDDGLAGLDAIRMPDVTRIVATGRGTPPKRLKPMFDGFGSWGGFDAWDDDSARLVDKPGYQWGKEPAWMTGLLRWMGVTARPTKTMDGAPPFLKLFKAWRRNAPTG